MGHPLFPGSGPPWLLGASGLRFGFSPPLQGRIGSSSRGRREGRLASPSPPSRDRAAGSGGCSEPAAQARECAGSGGARRPRRPHGCGRGAGAGQPHGLHPRRLRRRLAPSGQRRLWPGVPGAAQALADRVCHQVLPLPPAGHHQVPAHPAPLLSQRRN